MDDENKILTAIEEGVYYDANYNKSSWEEWFQEQKKEAEEQLRKFNTHKTRSFDEIIDKYSSALIDLKGDGYVIPTKMVFYCVVSNQLKHNFFTVDNKKIDLRIPLLIMIKAGHGKKNYEYFFKNTIQGLGKEYVEPSSYHPEQFCGKVITQEIDQKIEYIPVYGFLSSDFLLLDEAHLLLTSKKSEYEESLKHIRIGLDPIGSNEIEKKQVNIPYEHRLKYYPNCNIVLLSQPIANINEDLLLRGSFRRFTIIIVTTSIEERNEARRSSKFMEMKDDVNKRSWEDWIEFNRKLSNRKVKFVGTQEDYDIIDNYIDNLIDNLQSGLSKEALEYTNSIQYNIKFVLFKMAAIRAIVEQDSNIVKIEKRHIESAISDYSSIWMPQIAWIGQQLEITSDKPKGWKDELHSWILQGLIEEGEKGIHQTRIVDNYVTRYKGTYADNTLKIYCYRGIKQLKKWGLIEEFKENNLNSVLLRVTDEGKKFG